MANPWFRMYSEFATDPKVQMMSEEMQRRLLMLFCIRCSNGDVTLQEEEIAFQLRINEDEITKTRNLFVAKGFIDSSWNVLKWDKRQFASDTSKNRVQAFRERKRNKGVTLPKQKTNAIDTDSDTEEDTEKTTPSVSHEKIMFDGSKFQGINGYQAKWVTAFPAVNISQELAKAETWLISNPKNRKSNYARFLSNWLSKAQDAAPRVAQSSIMAGAV